MSWTDRRLTWLPGPPWAVAAGAAVAAAWSGWMVLGPSGDRTQLVSSLGLMASAGFASLMCFWRAQRSGGRVALAWGLFSLATGSWGIGQVTWTAIESLWNDEPFPSWADLGYLGFIPLAVAALLALPTRARSRTGTARALLDGLVVAASVLFVSWATVLEEVYRASRQGAEYLVGLAYPVGDVVLITVLLLTVASSRHHPRFSGRALVLLTAGQIALAVADGGFAYLSVADSYESGHPVDLAWFFGFALLGLAALQPVGCDHDDAQPDEVSPRPGLWAPYGAVAAALAVAAYRLAEDEQLGVVLSWIAIVLVVLITARHVLTLRENVHLTRHLEHRVAERTAALHRSDERFRSLVQHSSDVITVVDGSATITYQSPSGQRVLGYEAGTLEGSNLLDLVHPSDQESLQGVLDGLGSGPSATEVLELSVLANDGSWRQTETTVTNMVSQPAIGGLVLNTRDISERKSLERELMHSAFHDTLTQLANRRLFTDRLEHGLAHSRRHHRPIAVLFLDLDGFKAVNDSFGHDSGDVVLVEVADRLRDCVREADTVARLGGDEFAILLEDLAGESEVNAVAERVCEALRGSFHLDGRDVYLGGSVGIAASDTGAEAADELIRNADLAMYQAKAERNGGYRWYEPSMHRAVVRRLETDNDLRRALERGELYLEYQPIIELASGRITGAEALLRWEHPSRGLVSPAEFIPVAERNGLVVPIGEWVVGEACRQLRRWQDDHGDPSLSMSVNVSGRQLHRGDVAAAVAAAIDACGLAPGSLVLEVTESVLVDHSDEVLGHLDSLKCLGVRLAVDDFGTGYSALSYLHRLPVDVIKIDKFFVDGLVPGSHDAGLAGSIVTMGDNLHLVTVAEGVEHLHQLEALRAIGCHLAQGFLLSPPLAAERFDELLARSHRAPAADLRLDLDAPLGMA